MIMVDLYNFFSNFMIFLNINDDHPKTELFPAIRFQQNIGFLVCNTGIFAITNDMWTPIHSEGKQTGLCVHISTSFVLNIYIVWTFNMSFITIDIRKVNRIVSSTSVRQLFLHVWLEVEIKLGKKCNNLSSDVVPYYFFVAPGKIIFRHQHRHRVIKFDFIKNPDNLPYRSSAVIFTFFRIWEKNVTITD